MKRDIRTIILICVLLVSGCVNLDLPHHYYAPSASGVKPFGYGVDCPRSLDHIRLSDGGATLDIQGGRNDNKIFISIFIGEFGTNGPTIKMDLRKVSISDPGRNRIYFPLKTEQLVLRKSPLAIFLPVKPVPVEPVLNTNEGWYGLTYPDLGVDQFTLELPDILVGERVVKFPQVIFDKKFGFTCDYGK